MRFIFCGQQYAIEFRSGYAGVLHYEIHTPNPADNFCIRVRFKDKIRTEIESRRNPTENHIARKGLAADRRRRHNEFRQWAAKNNMTIGQALRYIHE